MASNETKSNVTAEQKRVPAIATAILTTSDGSPIGVRFTGAEKMGERSVYLTDLSPMIRDYAACHGLKQKAVDAAAISRNTETGMPATVAEKWAAVNAILDRITAPDGTWNEQTGGGGPGLLLRAVMELYPNLTEEKARDWLSKKTKAERDAMELNPKVKPILERLRAARVKDVNSDAMLDELGDLADGTE